VRKGPQGAQGAQGPQGANGSSPEHTDHPEHTEHLVIMLPALLIAALLIAAPLAAQAPDPRANECWGFVFGTWSPALNWTTAGHAHYAQGAPPAPEASSTGGAPRHDAASFERTGGPALVLYPTWWPVGVGITLERQPAAGDTVGGVAHAFVADGRATPPQSRIRAWRKPCN
jgi:hypothetical protein